MKRGMTIVETLIYVVIFTIVISALVQAMLTMSSSFTHIKQSRAINYSGVTALERMTREVKGAKSIDETGSVFNASPGRLKLDTAEFYVSGGKIVVKETGSSVESPLTSSKVNIDSLVFREIIATTNAVKIELKVSGRSFYTTSVLRGAY